MDVLVTDGRIRKLAENLESREVKVLDASGCLVTPGFIDLHAHFRDPGNRDEETTASGSRAAVKGGFTTVCVMPNTDPLMDNSAVVSYVVWEAQKAGLCRILPVARATVGDEITETHRLREAGAVGVSNDGEPITPASRIRTVLQCAGDAGLLVMDHPEELSLSRSGIMHEGRVSDLLGMPAAPAEAETIAVERDISVAGLTGGRLHLQHLSTRGSAEALERAKSRGLRVTGEVTPHHLLLSDELMRGFDSVYKVNPPLRPDDHRAALLEALRTGVIDAVATDHAPHRAEEKELDLLQAPSGMASIEYAWAVLYTKLVMENMLGLSTLVERLTAGPARVLAIDGIGSLKPGTSADITVLDPEASEVVGEKPYASLSSNCPYRGWEVKGLPRWTIFAGRVVFDRESA